MLAQIWSIIQDATTVTVLVAASALFVPFIRDALSHRLQSKLRRSVDQDLENLRSELRRSEERLKTELTLSAKRLEALNAALLTGQAGRVGSVHTRKMKALEVLWLAKAHMGKAYPALTFTAVKNFDELCQMAKDEETIRAFYKNINDMFPSDELKKLPNIEAERPFLTQNAWAAYSAYKSLMGHALIKLQYLVHGAGKPESHTDEPVNRLLKQVLPTYADYIDKYGSWGHQNLLGALENKLIEASNEIMAGGEDDQLHLMRAETLMRAINQTIVTDQLIEANSGVLPELVKAPPLPQQG